MNRHPDRGTSNSVGPIGRLGRWTACHFGIVVAVWAAVAVSLGALAPRVEHALSGAGWEATGSESVRVREIVQRDFNGNSSASLMVVAHSSRATIDTPAFKRTIEKVGAILRADPAVSSVTMPRRGFSISADGRTAVIQAGASKNTDKMVRAADDLKRPLSRAGSKDIKISLTGSSGMWSDFNKANKEAMLKSEVLSWPITLAIMVLAFGSLVAAGLPLMLTILGLIAAAGSLYLATKVADVSIWAMNFAMMFALALGIDYALFIVARFRAALLGSGQSPVEAAATAMDTAGKAVLFSGITVLISLSAVMLVPSPAFRSMSLGIMLAVVFVLAAALTLLPAVLGKLGTRVDRFGLPWVHSGEHRSRRFATWAERLWRHPVAYGLAALTVLLILSLPLLRIDTGMPSIKVVPKGDSSRQGYREVQDAFGKGAPGALQIVAPQSKANTLPELVQADRGIARVMPAQTGRVDQLGGTVVQGRRLSHIGFPARVALIQAIPKQDPSDPAVGTTIERLRAALPAGVLIGGAAAENHDLESALAGKTALAIGIVLALGFLLLLVALRAPLIAAAGVATNLLATAAAFGIATLIFQDGDLTALLGFEPQGFLDAWAPIFFFAMIFAIAMDYTVFLLASAKEHWDRSADPRDAMVGGVAHSGRTIMAAAGVMVAVFFTFALSGPLPPKEMGLILGCAVLLDAVLVRLVLIPVILRVFGRAAWWLPGWLDRLLPEVRFGHGTSPAR